MKRLSDNKVNDYSGDSLSNDEELLGINIEISSESDNSDYRAIRNLNELVGRLEYKPLALLPLPSIDINSYNGENTQNSQISMGEAIRREREAAKRIINYSKITMKNKSKQKIPKSHFYCCCGMFGFFKRKNKTIKPISNTEKPITSVNMKIY